MTLRTPSPIVRPAGIAVALSLAMTLALGGAKAPREARAGHRVLSSDASGLTLRATFPGARVGSVATERGDYASVRVDGAPAARRANARMLPEYALLVAVPAGTTPRLEVLDMRTRPLDLRLPAGTLRRGDEGGHRAEPVADGGGPGPARLLAVTQARRLRLARLVISPVFHDDNGWHELETIDVAVRFDGRSEDPGVAADGWEAGLAAMTVNPELSGIALQQATQGAPIPAPRPSAMGALKILVREEGLHRVTHADLTTAGIDPTGFDTATFVLTRRANEVSIEMEDGGDGSFDSGDRFYFYGIEVGGEETWDNVYRLTAGVSPGLRMSARDAAPGAETPVTEFRNELFEETDILYFASVPETSPTPWLWESLAVSVPGVPVFTDRVVQLDNIAAAGTARLEVRVQSRRETPGFSPNHHARILVNGNLVDDQSWTGLESILLAADFPQAWLVEGANTIRIENPADLGLSLQTEYTDYFRLFYRDSFVAESDYLRFTSDGTGPWRAGVTGFSGEDTRFYDVTDPDQPVRLTGLAADAPGCMPCGAELADLGAVAGVFVGLRPSVARTPWGFVADAPADLRDHGAAGADMLVVSYDGFHGAVQPLVAHRQAEGLRVVSARLTDVYDEFNGGVAETEGLRNFVRWAFENYTAPAPSYLLLVGDATFDPKDLKGQADDYLSARLIHAPGFGLVPSDTWFAAVSGDDDVPDLAVGRISARNTTDVTTYVDNLIDYETMTPQTALNSGLLYVTDDDDPQFGAVSDHLVDTFHPPAMAARRVDLATYPQTGQGAADARDDIVTAIDDGSLVTVYFGHGSRTSWATENLWQNSDVGSLSGAGNLTFVVALNCVNAFFTNLDIEPYSLGEQWNRKSGRGAVANWAPSALGTLFNYQVIGDQLFHQLFDLKEERMGRAAWTALVDAHLLNSVDIVNVRDMIFFGDPAAVLPLDSDGDGFRDRTEVDAGSDPDDGDGDDDGLTDDAESNALGDSDGDGLVNAADADSDNDGLPDGLESGLVAPSGWTDVAAGHFIADTDPGTTTHPLLPDSDGGGAPDGAEDRDSDGAVDPGETDPDDPADDPVCALAAPPEMISLTLQRDGDDMVLSWDASATGDPCVLYRVYVADTAPGDTFEEFRFAATTTVAGWRHAGAALGSDPVRYLVTAISPLGGEGLLGHFGR